MREENSRELNLEQGIFSGLLAGTVVSGLLFLAQLTGFAPIDLSLYIGTAITGAVSPNSWLLGFVVYLIAAAIVGLIFGAIFDAWGESGLVRGVILGIPYAIVAGLAIWALGYALPPELQRPGFMAADLGTISALGFLLVHMIFGGIIGGSYRMEPAYAAPAAPEYSRDPARVWGAGAAVIGSFAMVLLAAFYMYASY